MRIEGSTALLTGATGGLGRGMASRLAARGARLVLSSRHEEALETLRDSLPGEGHSVLVADLADRSQTHGLIERAAEAGGAPITLLVNNAGLEMAHRYDEIAAEDLERMVEVNLVAPMLLTRAAIPPMLDAGKGHVVQISSAAGLAGLACNEPYSATKSALIRLTESLRSTYEKEPLGFSTVCPGFTTGGGMYTRMEEGGHKANSLIGTTTVEDVADSVVKVVEEDLPLVVSNNRPLRPLAALGVLAPSLVPKILDMSGANDLMRSVAAQRTRTGA